MPRVTDLPAATSVDLDDPLYIVEDGNSRRVTIPQILAAVSFWDYESAETALPGASTQTNFAHGLGARPSDYQVVLRCTTAANGYSIGDEIPLQSVFTNASGLQFNAAISVNSTNITLSNSPNGWTVVPKAGGSLALITTSNYRIIVRAKR